MKDIFQVTSSALPDDTRVAGFRGTEAVSRPYQFDVYLLVPEDQQELDIADAVGAKATLELTRDDDKDPFVFHGIFSAFALLHTLDGRSLFHATLVPQLWQLSQTLHSRIFTNKSIPDIIKEVLEDGGLGGSDYTLKLAQDYKPQEHVCQYQESDLDFISRWMEREGMYYYFEQGEDGEKLVIADDKSFAKPLGDDPIRFYALAGHDHSARESLHVFTCHHRALPARVKLKDYDYTKPTLDVSGSAPVSSSGLGEISVYGARFFTPDEGKRLAKLRAEELLARQVVYQGNGTSYYLRTGYTFKLEDHPRQSFDAKYFVTELSHYGNQAVSSPDVMKLTGLDSTETYRVDVTAIPATVQFRAPAATAWPRIYGFENGTVCGPAESEYAQIDEHGRYNVKFKFDESDLKDGKASTWVRMLQPHGGSIEGWHFPLRKGTEILFTFLGGDPDRPVISGVVPNAHTPSPVTRANHTTNVIQTGGRNRFELEDTAGSQRITLQTPHTNTMIRMGAPNDDHNLIVRTDGRTLLDAGQDWDVTVGGHLDEDVTGPVHEHYHNTRETTVHGDAEETWESTLTSEVTGKTVQTYKGPHEIKSEQTRKDEVEGVCTEKYGGAVGRTYEQTLEETVDHGAVIKYEGAGLTQEIKTKYECTVTGKAEHSATEEWSITAPTVDVKSTGQWKWTALGDHVGLTISMASETFVGLKNENHVGIKMETLVGGKVEMWLAAKLELGAGLAFEQVPEAIELKIGKLETLQHRINTIAGPYVVAGAIWLATHGMNVIA